MVQVVRGSKERLEPHLVVVDDTGRELSAAAKGEGWWCSRVRETGRHPRGGRDGDFSPGAVVDLLRTGSSVGVMGRGSDQLAGYLAERVAEQVTSAMDQGKSVTAVSLRGRAPGDEGPMVLLVGYPDAIAHLMGVSG